VVVCAVAVGWDCLSWDVISSVLSRTKKALSGSIWSFLIVVAILGLNFWLIHRFTYAHLYLLSDNRHFTFYIWKRLFMKYDWFKFSLIPLYWISGLLLWKLLGTPFAFGFLLTAANLFMLQTTNPYFGGYA